MAEKDARRQRHHLANEGRYRKAARAATEPIPVQPGVEASLGVAALITHQGATGGAGEAAGAGDGDGAGFAVVRREGQGGTVGLGSSHRRATQDPPCNRADRQGPAPPQWRSAAVPNVQPGWLVKPLPRRGAWKGLRHRPHRVLALSRGRMTQGFVLEPRCMKSSSQRLQMAQRSEAHLHCQRSCPADFLPGRIKSDKSNIKYKVLFWLCMPTLFLCTHLFRSQCCAHLSLSLTQSPLVC